MIDFADILRQQMEKYANVVGEEIEIIAKQVAKEGTIKLKEASPKGEGSHKGHYSDGWRVKEIRTGNTSFSFVIYNAKKPGLTHLLEDGHQLRQGGRAKAYPHIKKVEEWCVKEFEKRMERKLSE